MRFDKGQLALSVAIALSAGAFSIIPSTAFALPSGLASDTATQTTADGTMTITGTAANNLLKWDSFSIAGGETVAFANKNNYMNVVTGSDASSIFGTITGGGTVYLINPNGILFGSTSSVNVGNLVASTRNITDEQLSAFKADGTNPILTTTVSEAAGDITNLGTIKASSVVIEGNNIILKSTSDITNSSGNLLSAARDTSSDHDQTVGNVTVKAAGTIKIGYADTKNANKTDGNQTTYAKYDASNTARKLGYILSDLSGYNVTAANTDKSASNKELQVQATALLNSGKYQEYMLVHNATELQTLASSASDKVTTAEDGTTKTTTGIYGNYFLTDDIDLSSIENFMPIGTSSAQFLGDFNGLGYTISGLTETTMAAKSPAGLFGTVGSSGVVENVTLTNVSIADNYKNNVGAVAGLNSGTVQNVTVGAASGDTSTITGTVGEGAVGGIVGDNKGTISNAINYASVVNGKRIGGIAGINEASGTVSQAANHGMLSGRNAKNGKGGVTGQNAGTLSAVSNTGNILYSSKDASYSRGSIAGANTGTITYITAEGTMAQTSDADGLVADESATATALAVTGDSSGATISTDTAATGNSLFAYTAPETGGSTGTETGGSTGTETGGSTGTETGGSTGTETGGSTGTETGGSTGTETGGSTGTETGGSTGTETGGSAGTETGGTTGAETEVERQLANITESSRQAASANQQAAARTENQESLQRENPAVSAEVVGRLADGSLVVVTTGTVANVEEDSSTQETT